MSVRVGIEWLNAYCGQTALNIRTLFEGRQLDLERFDNLMMENKSVGVACEDPITNAVNAAKPIIDQLSEAEKGRIEMVITASESGIDFGKSLSTYIHKHLNLQTKCRLFEIKQACYGGTAALQMAANFVVSQASPGAKVLVIATDIARAAARNTYAEPSQGVAAVAMLVGEDPQVLELDFGANGYHGYEVMDTCRPEPELETGDADLSLLSYLDCLEASYQSYCDRVEGADLQQSFNYLVFHAPFGGMVKGAHRKLMRSVCKAPPKVCEPDFERRVLPSLRYCSQVGNVYSASVYLSLCGLLDSIQFQAAQRVGVYSYGSGCSSEFYSGIVGPSSNQRMAKMDIASGVANRYSLDMETYDKLLDISMGWMFGMKNKVVDISEFQEIYDRQFKGKGLLVLREVKDYYREYEWS
ncbi:MAG: 3-hydroxy-3-methylglutaryl-ACP synthase [Thiotrichales bacterium]|nr:MAG: 3-hydroxy-3-methylglutaryl-ACP synthase [Thiotrichales bacterium]